MLASQFLSVVIDEGANNHDANQVNQPDDEESPSSNSAPEDNGFDSNLIQELEAVCKVPKVLLAECTVSVVNPDKIGHHSIKECRFDAYVTPVDPPKPRLTLKPLHKLQEQRVHTEEEVPFRNIEDLLQGVEAVYSDEDDGGGGGGGGGSGGGPVLGRGGGMSVDPNVYRKALCQVCKRSFFSNGPTACRRCQSYQSKGLFGGDEYVPRGFQCNVCGKVYSQRSVLKKHEAVHSGYRLRCKVCGIDFTQRSSLLRHCKRIHGIQSDHDIPTPLVPPAPIVTIGGKNLTHTTPSTKFVPGLAERLTALLSKKDDSITLALKKPPLTNIGGYKVDPHTVMTITPDVIIQTEQS